MTSVLLYVNPASAAVLQASDFKGAGLNVLEVVEDRHKLVQCVVQHAPDVLVCALGDTVGAHGPDEAFFAMTSAIAENAPCAVMVFTPDESDERIVQATASGVHAYVVNGYARARLPSLVRVAQARFAHERALQHCLADASSRLEERKVVDRAKAILMRARELSDDDAFRVLRAASMHSNQRLGQVSKHIIHSAHFAEGVNRAGQLRMLSQRLVKLYLLQLLQPSADAAKPHRLLFEASVQRIDANLVLLDKNFSKYTFGDVLGQTATTWSGLKHALQANPTAREMALVDDLAEQLLEEAERLTSALEKEGAIAPLQMLNTAGRQRMLSQRFAKYALLGVLGSPGLAARGNTGLASTRTAFEQAQHYLSNLPLSTLEIRRALEAARLGWQHTLAGAGQAQRADGQAQLALASEELLGVFEQLSATYESSMQMLMG